MTSFSFPERLSAWFGRLGRRGLRQAKKGGCRKGKCSKWKGGCCRCGRE